MKINICTITNTKKHKNHAPIRGKPNILNDLEFNKIKLQWMEIKTKHTSVCSSAIKVMEYFLQYISFIKCME